MSLIQAVVALIRERGPSTVDDLAPLMSGNTRVQVMQALQNAKTEGWLECKQGKGLGGGKGKQPGTFSISTKPRSRRVRVRDQRVYEPPRIVSEWKEISLPRVASVFDLGAALCANEPGRRAA